ncbi:MAG: MBOAT family protein [Rhodospirillaceae bacterium]|nr:MBOAT family protein [Rhodospirillales bacterium]
MLFTSNEFLFVFLPLTIIGFLLLRRGTGSNKATVYFLLLASLVFYSWWDARYLALILISMGFNFPLSRFVTTGKITPRTGIWVGVGLNLTLLTWFKYSSFVNTALESNFGITIPHYAGELPLAISFFTFLQIAYVVDTCRGKAGAGSIIDYFLFVTFFPHLIAGPLVHHSELIPQFHRIGRSWNVWKADFAIGFTVFALGFFKKVGLADSIAPLADVMFDNARNGITPSFFVAWFGALSYSLQLYFDFSGYSDMAIGLSRMFCLRLPINFNSPYQSLNIIEFWKRWHITLSRFLKDYLYIPLGGGRVGAWRRYLNLMIVMVLGGLWHGAGWQFILWGALHGTYLMINHGWRRAFGPTLGNHLTVRLLSWAITFTAVVVAWVPFRAADVATAVEIWRSMIGLNGISVPRILAPLANLAPFLRVDPTDFDGFAQVGRLNIGFMAAGLMIALLLPNIYQFMIRRSPALWGTSEQRPSESKVTWVPSSVYALASIALFAYSLSINEEGSPFLYFQF